MKNQEATPQVQHTPVPWTYRIGRWSPESPPFGFCIEAFGKVPFVASVNMAGPNHAAVIPDSDLKFITTGFSGAEVEANAQFIVLACNNHARLTAQNAALVEALKLMLTHQGQITHDFPKGECRQFVIPVDHIKQARAALQSAQG